MIQGPGAETVAVKYLCTFLDVVSLTPLLPVLGEGLFVAYRLQKLRKPETLQLAVAGGPLQLCFVSTLV